MERTPTTQELRRFGLIVVSIFGLLGLWPALFHSRPVRLWELILAGLLAIPALAFPRKLARIYQGWMIVGDVLVWINTRVIMGMIFFVVVTPLGLVRRLMGKDPMLRCFEPGLESYRARKASRQASHMTVQY